MQFWREVDRAILNPSYKLELDPILITPRLFYRVGYLLYAFIINGILFFNQGRLYDLALYSLSYCQFPSANPFSKEFYYKLNPKSNFSKRFNELTYKTINKKCKYYYNLISSSQKKACIVLLFIRIL